MVQLLVILFIAALLLVVFWPRIEKAQHERRVDALGIPAFVIPRGGYGPQLISGEVTGFGHHKYDLEIVSRSVCVLDNGKIVASLLPNQTYDAILQRVILDKVRVKAWGRITSSPSGDKSALQLELPDYEWFKEKGYWPYN